MQIEGFSNYFLKENVVINKKTNKAVSVTISKKGERRLKLFDDVRGWRSVNLSEVLANAGLKLSIPTTARKILNSNGKYFIDITGEVYSFTNKSRQGKILKPRVGTDGYLQVSINYKGKLRTCSVHKLVAETFLMPDYVQKKLCCMHKDNNKLNCHIDNLEIGTYSTNNKNAYRDNLNTGNLEWRTKKALG
jgi:hypothetical protein